ncbi:MAG: hypothetical protein A3E82_07630 [Gammaproteobacteria bacterium RIFCSPHIGHO2_12_FULL_38_11]|nr:MAG: hypothetical protein A3E82_07630 [Gammaproteobacteria bacterium RIFCSPHIGHO2_12_FULL_38_11]
MKKNRIASFDGLRGIAVLCVVFHHCFAMLPGLDSHYPGQLFKYGWLGVDLFFIISGFVISFTLYKYNDVKKFAIARFARLYPAYWAAIIFSAFLVFIAGDHLNLVEYAANFLMFQDLLHFQNVSGVFWTLSFELTFYVFAACIFYFGQFSKHKIFVAWLVFSFAWDMIYFLGYVPPHSMMTKIGYLFILAYTPLFIFGIYLHRAFSQGWSKSIVYMLLFSALIFTAFLPGVIGNINQINPLLNVSIYRSFVILLFLLCAYATYFPDNTYLSSKFLTFCGKISYSWYLTHLMIAGFTF